MLQDPFPDRGLMKLAERFGSSVFRLCIFLGLTNTEVDNIKMSNPHNAETWGYKALIRWQNNLEKGVSHKNALDMLKTIFMDADRVDLVEKADDLLEEDTNDNDENSPDDDTFKKATKKAKAGFEEMVKVHEEKLKEVEEKFKATLKVKNDEIRQQKQENNNKMAEVQKKNSQKVRENDEQIEQLEKKVKNLLAGKSSDKNNNSDSSVNKPSILEDKLPKGVVQQYKAYNCACNLPSCMRCQVLPQAEELVGGGSLCQKEQARWQRHISAIKCGSRSTKEWRSLRACPHCHTFECNCQHWNTVASILLLCQDQTDASPDVTTRSEVVAMMEKVQASACEDQKPLWQLSINHLQQYQGTLQQWGNSTWRCADCKSNKCSRQWLPVNAKLFTTIEAMSQ